MSCRRDDGGAGDLGAGAYNACIELSHNISRWTLAFLIMAMIVTMAVAQASINAGPHHGDSPADAPQEHQEASYGIITPESVTTSNGEANSGGGPTGSKKDVVFKTNSDPKGNMDQYLYRSDGPISFRIFTYADKDAVKNVRLVMRVYDVDQQGAEGCGPEVDHVYVNGNFVGALTGANGQWSIVSFPLQTSWVKWMGDTDENYGENNIRVDIDVTGSACWATQVDWAEIRAEQRPLVFVPGIAGTELLNPADTDGINGLEWLDLGQYMGDDDVEDLALDSTGNNPANPAWTITYGKIIRDAPGPSFGQGDVYGKYIEFLRTKGYFSSITIQEHRDKITPWLFGENPLTITPLPDSNIRFFEFPYDWRKDLTQTASRLATEITSIKQETEWDQVFLTAHSMGGLISKKYIKSGGDQNVKMLFTMGTPYYGAAKAYYILKVGEDMTGTGLMEAESIRSIAQNMSAVYHLLPSPKYWQAVGAPVFDDYKDPNSDGSLDITGAYLTDPEAKLSNPALVNNAIAFHNSLGNDFGSVKEVYLLIGTGQPTTKEWIYLGGTSPNPYYNPHTGDGDGTVPYESAYAKFESGVTGRWQVVGEHVGLPGMDGVQNLLWSKIKGAVANDPVLAFSGFTDYGLDKDGDGLYDYLVVRFNATASTPGNYTVRGQLNETQTSNRYIISTAINDTIFNAGETKEISLLFRGDQIYSKNYTGNFTINTMQFYDGMDQEATNYSIHTTSSYTPSQFEPVLFFGAGPVTVINATDSGIDTDGDGLYDHLRIVVNFNITTTGTYRFWSWISGDTPNSSIAIGANENFMSGGIQPVTFNFSGWDIYRARLNTTYNVSYNFDFNRDNNYTQFDNAFITKFYNFTQFDPVPVALTGNYTDQGIDKNSNGLYELLSVGVKINVTEPGSYTLHGSLLANQTNKTNHIATASASAVLSPGLWTLYLNFSGEEIFLSGVNGTYLFGNINLILNGSTIYSDFQFHDTAAYNYTDFEPPSIFFTGNFTETTVDTNSNGQYDTLRIGVEVQSKTAGYYNFNTRLKDKNGSEIQWISGSQYIAKNTPTMVYLNFAGMNIFASAKNGPYTVKDFSIYMVVDEALTLDNLYTTAFYNYTDFDHSGNLVKGRVTYANGTGVYGQTVAAMGTTFATTDSSGNYTIPVPTTGKNEIVLYPTETGNWWVLVNGTYISRSTDIFVDVTPNATAIADFTLSPPGSGSCSETPVNGCFVNRSIILDPDSYYLPLGVDIVSDDIVLDCGGSLISGYPVSSYNNGLNISGRRNVTVKNCEINSFNTGIYASAAWGSLFENNTLSLNTDGIKMSVGSANTIQDTNSSGNKNAGIYLIMSNYTTIRNATLWSNSYGLQLSSSGNNTITGSNASNNNNYGIYLTSSSNNNAIEGNNVSNNYYGIYLSSSGNNTIAANNENKNTYGIFLSSSSNNSIERNSASGNTFGIEFSSSSRNIITGNNVSNNNYGIYLSSSSYNTLEGNDAGNNYNSGIYLSYSDSNIIKTNNASSNNYGFYFYYSSNNLLNNNTVAANKNLDFSIYSSVNSGYNNTCDRPDGWNDDNVTGCTYLSRPISEYPDFTVENLTWSPYNFNTSQSVTLDATVKNTGYANSTGGFYVGFYIDGEYINSAYVSTAIGVNQTANAKIYWTANKGGANRVFTARADYNNYWGEVNETNNALDAIVPYISGPDLIVENITWSPDSYSSGQPVIFNATVKNIGEVSSPFTYSYVRFYIDGNPISTNYWSGSLAPNASFTFTSYAWSALPGNRTVRAYADNYDNIPETNETNNNLSVDLPYTIGPDLIVEKITWSPQSFSSGQYATFTATVKNIGEINSTANSIYVHLYMDENYISTRYWYGSVVSGSNFTIDFSSWAAIPGNHTVRAYADVYGYVPETNETNNNLSASLPYIPGPDLVITGLNWSSANYTEGSTVTFYANVTNIGDVPTGFHSEYVRFYIDGNYIKDNYGYVNISVGQSMAVSNTWTAVAGNHTLSAKADFYNYVYELDETNNEASILISVITAQPSGVIPFPGMTALPTDPDGDGIFEDINGNTRKDFNDVVLFFNNLEWIPGNEPAEAFDFNGNSGIDFADIVRLFEEV